MAIYTVRYQGKVYKVRSSTPPTVEQLRSMTTSVPSRIPFPAKVAQVGKAVFPFLPGVPGGFERTMGTAVGAIPESSLPAVGTITGGIAGTAIPIPGSSIAGAGIGAAFGKAEQLRRRGARGRPTPPFQAAKQIALTGLGGAASEAVPLAGIKGLAKVSPPFLKAIGRHIPTVFSGKRQADLARRSREAYLDLKRGAGREIEQAIAKIEQANPETTVDISAIAQRMKEEIVQNPKLASDLAAGMRRSGDRTLQALLEDPALGQAVTFRDLQKLKLTLNKVPSLSAKQGKFGAQFSDTDISVLEHLNDIRASQLEAFPEFAPAAAQYRQRLETFRTFKPFFKEGKTVQALKTGFGDPELLQKFEQTFPKEVVGEVTGFRRATKAKNVAVPLVKGGVALEAARRIFGGR